jgi:hypothetical protein
MILLADALAQIPCLAHVNHRAQAILHQVHAWPVRQLAELASNDIRRWHCGEYARSGGGWQSRRRDKALLKMPGWIELAKKQVEKVTELKFKKPMADYLRGELSDPADGTRGLPPARRAVVSQRRKRDGRADDFAA